MLEKLAITGEEDPPFFHRDFDELAIFGVGVKPHVEAQKAQDASELPQMDVGHEGRMPEGARPESGEGGDVQGLEHRIHGYPIAVL